MPSPYRCIRTHTLMMDTPSHDGENVSDLLFNEQCSVLESEGGWSLIRCRHDDYEGWVESAALVENTSRPGNLVCTRLKTIAFNTYDVSDRALHVGLGTRITEQQRKTITGPDGQPTELIEDAISGLWFFANDFAPFPLKGDYTDSAALFVGVPYVWGGRSCDGIDCSGLVQVCVGAHGHKVDRDTSKQIDTLGQAVPFPVDEEMKRGDIVLMPGHVVIATGASDTLHANGIAMIVERRPLLEVIAERNKNWDDLVLRRLA